MTLRTFILLFAFAVAIAAPSAAQQTAAPTRTPDVIFVPTPQEVVDAMLKVAKVTKNDVIYDLGSGDGRIPVTAAKVYGARAIGIDIDPQRIKKQMPTPRPLASRTRSSSSIRICSRPTSAKRRW